MDYFKEEDCVDVFHEYTSSELYSGVQYFWRNKSSIHLTIVQHSCALLPGVAEIIAYDPILRGEAPRLYCNLEEIEKQLDKQQIDARLPAAKAKAEALGVDFDEEAFRLSTLNDLKVGYLLTRLAINSANKNNIDKLRNLMDDKFAENTWTISLIPHFHDRKNEETGLLTILCCKPNLLKPYVVDRVPPKEKRWQVIKRLFRQYARSLVMQHRSRKGETMQKETPSNVMDETVDSPVKRKPLLPSLRASFDHLLGGQNGAKTAERGIDLPSNHIDPVIGRSSSIDSATGTRRRLSVQNALSIARECVEKLCPEPVRRLSLQIRTSVSSGTSSGTSSDSTSTPVSGHVLNKLFPLLRGPSKIAPAQLDDMDPTERVDSGRKVMFKDTIAEDAKLSPKVSSTNGVDSPRGILVKRSSSRHVGNDSPTSGSPRVFSTPRGMSNSRLTKGSSNRNLLQTCHAHSSIETSRLAGDDKPPTLTRQASRSRGSCSRDNGGNSLSGGSQETEVGPTIHLKPISIDEASIRFSGPSTPSTDTNGSSATSSGESLTSPRPRTFARFNASYYYNQNSQHKRSYQTQLQRMNSARGGGRPLTSDEMTTSDAPAEQEDMMDEDYFTPSDCTLSDRKLFDTSPLLQLQSRLESTPHEDECLLSSAALKTHLTNYVQTIIRHTSSHDHELSI